MGVLKEKTHKDSAMGFNKKNDFYIHLISDSSSSYFPGNVTSEFTTHLAQEENLTGQWEVALCNIFYHRTWVNIPTAADGSCALMIWEREDGPRTSFVKRLKIEAHLEPGSYSTPKALISALFEKFRFLERWDSGKANGHNYFALSEILDISHNVSTNKLSFAVKENPYSCDGIKLNFSTTLMDLIGHVEYINVPPDIHKRVDSIQIALAPGESEEPTAPPKITLGRTTNLHAGIYNLFIYTNLVENQPVGDSQAQLLRIVPVQGEVGEYLYEAFEDRQYVPLHSNTFNSIQVLIGDRFGHRIKFNHGSAPVILVLHFKRVS